MKITYVSMAQAMLTLAVMVVGRTLEMETRAVDIQSHVVATAGEQSGNIESRSIPPSRDPFYVPPTGFENTLPGAVLRNRPIIVSFSGILPNLFIDAHQILYRTTAIDGSAIASVTTVFKPAQAKKNRFITYNAAYDSSDVDCSPSYMFKWGTSESGNIDSSALIQVYLAEGYIVNSPDYEGPEAAFTASRLSGMGVLDSMRAVQNFGRKHFGFNDKPALLVSGYSGGGLATAWASVLQPKYAPELNVKGWVMGGVPANLTAMVEYIDNTLVSGFLPVSIAGLLKPSAYGTQLGPIVDKIVTDKGRKAISNGNSKCGGENLVLFAEQSVFDEDFQNLGHSFLREPTIASILSENILGVNKQETPTAPVFMYHAENDEVVLYTKAFQTYQEWCKNGANVQFIRYAAGGHITTQPLSILKAVDFIHSAFQETVPRGCSFDTEVGNPLSPVALGLNLEPILKNLIDFVSRVGDDKNVLDTFKKGRLL